MKAKLVFFTFFMLFFRFPCATSSAGSFVHPRRVWAITTSDMRQAVIAVDAQTCWNLYQISRIESVCTDDGHCTEVVGVESCRNPLLPFGFLFHLRKPLISVGDLFSNPSVFGRELTDMSRDSRLSRLVRQVFEGIQQKNRMESDSRFKRSAKREKSKLVAWFDESAPRWSAEYGAALNAGVWSRDLQEGVVFLYGGSLRLGFRFQDKLESHHSSDCLSELFWDVWDFVRGNQYGADLRFHWIREADHNRFLMGMQLLSRYVSKPNMEFGRVRFPGLISWAVPEGGLIVNDHSDLGGYIRFVFPVSVLLTHDMGLELRLTQAILWEEETSFFWSAEVGFFVRNF